MNETLIPEIIKSKLPNQPNSQTLNLTLKNIDKRDYSINHENYINKTTNIANINKSGLFKFIFELITLPFRIIYKSVNYVFTKYDLKTKWRLELISIKKDRWKRKWLKKQRSVWNNDEVF